MTRSLAAVIAAVSISGATAVALLVGGEHSAPPPSIRSPIVGATYPGYVAQAFSWDPAVDATGFRVYLDGIVIGLVPVTRTGTTISISCGVQHRFNAQPFNNKGFAPLAPPVYVTVGCEKATT